MRNYRIAAACAGTASLVLSIALLSTFYVPAGSSRHQSQGAFSAVKLVSAPDQPISFEGVGALVGPVLGVSQPDVSEGDALVFLEGDKYATSLTGTPTLPDAISLVTYENQFGQTNGDGPDAPSVPRQLAWFAEFDGIHSTANLPLGHPKDENPNVVCTLYIAVSALGKPTSLDGFSFCK